MSSKYDDFMWLSAQQDQKPKKKQTLTVDELIELLRGLKEEHGGDTLVFVRAEYEWHRPVKTIVKLNDEKKLYID